MDFRLPAPLFYPVHNRLAFLLLGIAFFLRISNLSVQSLWLDETVHLIQARVFLQSGNLQTGGDNNGILFTMLLIPVLKVFGIVVENARIVSVIFGLGSLVLIYVIAKKLFSPSVGLIALTLAVFSPYIVFWSKIARNYSIFLFFCLLAAIQIIDLVRQDGKKNTPLFAKISLLLLTLAAGFASHYLMLLFVVAAVVWLLVLKKNQIIGLMKSNLKIVAAGMATMVIILAGIFWLLSKNQNLLAWVLPDLRHLREIYSQAPFYSLATYANILLHDWNFLIAFGALGLFLLFRGKQFEVLTFFICFSIVPFLMLSFIFREPTAARYLIFVYPFFLIIAAFGVCQAGLFLEQKAKRFFIAPKPYLGTIISALLLLPMFPLKNLQSVHAFSFSEEQKPDNRIIECVFSNWKQPCDYLKTRLQQNDVVMATLPQVASVYLNRSDIVSFRQLHLDPVQKKYVPNQPDISGKNSALTVQDLVRTVQKNKRGWFLADFYLESVMTDPAARNFVFQNFHFYPEASVDGDVTLFGWDKDLLAPKYQNMILQVGRGEKPYSRDLTFQVPEALLRKSSIQMRYRTKFVEHAGEAFFEINSVRLPLAVSSQNSEIQSLDIPINALRRGQNVFRFSYIGSPELEKLKGYVLYYLEFVP